MSADRLIVTIKADGETLNHMAGINYSSLCGIDSDSPLIENYPVETPKGAKIDCRICIGIWLECRNYRKSYMDNVIVNEMIEDDQHPHLIGGESS